ncbi:CDAN1-interacting nuclease 1 isoform X2 [Glossina fuscipes]|uniref:CDAN1-interacting nuclease 1 n=1 Tax=Glossina fuscipes TaxID=7396 RepID=A0A9C5Z1A6_9MUSC|nr:CDAN1-interacting nuclease 1 isoform X2 [Glossina fuscipes]
MNEKATTVVKKRILISKEYKTICDFIDQFEGLAIDCEIALLQKFPSIESLTLKAILQVQVTTHIKALRWRHESRTLKYNKCSSNSKDSDILLKIAREHRVGPVTLCRYILKFKYEMKNKAEIAHLLKYPQLIEDQQLSANIIQCMCSDNQDGPLVDLKRRILGEEYEFKLKDLATKAGMHFHDENELRRLGYDKTPDLKMILPFLFRGEVINWIESKAGFGDIKSHRYYTQQQYQSYCNRFGPGIVIYWMGYQEETATLPDNDDGIIVLDDFPRLEDLELLDLSKTMQHLDNVNRYKHFRLLLW